MFKGITVLLLIHAFEGTGVLEEVGKGGTLSSSSLGYPHIQRFALTLLKTSQEESNLVNTLTQNQQLCYYNNTGTAIL